MNIYIQQNGTIIQQVKISMLAGNYLFETYYTLRITIIGGFYFYSIRFNGIQYVSEFNTSTVLTTLDRGYPYTDISGYIGLFYENLRFVSKSLFISGTEMIIHNSNIIQSIQSCQSAITPSPTTQPSKIPTSLPPTAFPIATLMKTFNPTTNIPSPLTDTMVTIATLMKTFNPQQILNHQ